MDTALLQTARHESRHALLLDSAGWKVTQLEAWEGGSGNTTVDERFAQILGMALDEPESRQETIDLFVVTLAAALANGKQSSAQDLAQADAILRLWEEGTTSHKVFVWPSARRLRAMAELEAAYFCMEQADAIEALAESLARHGMLRGARLQAEIRRCAKMGEDSVRYMARKMA